MKKLKILFVCLGNICRSPAAEAVMKYKVKSRGLIDQFELDSAGTMGYHVGEKADSRMIGHALLRGIEINSISRKIDVNIDFNYFDLIVAMDDTNYHDLLLLEKQVVNSSAKIVKICSFNKLTKAAYVPDPYYGTGAGFDIVLDILSDTCEGLLEYCLHNEF